MSKQTFAVALALYIAGEAAGFAGGLLDVGLSQAYCARGPRIPAACGTQRGGHAHRQRADGKFALDLARGIEDANQSGRRLWQRQRLE